MKEIYGINKSELEDYFVKHGDKKFRALQIYEWLYDKNCSSFRQMTNLKKEVIELLERDFTFSKISIIKKEEDEGVVKYLFNLEDGNKIEAVLMYHDYGNSLCISSQVGCNIGCSFCESGRLKKVRDLTSGEMVSQILKVQKDLSLRITHVVIMGIGEPFDNYDNVINFIKIINEPKGINIGIRHITVSTSGIIPKIEKFMNENMQVNLAISLHAPNNEIRNKIMKINKAYPIEELIKTVKKYIKVTNRKVTFEYILLKDINDSKENAKELADLVKGINCNINLIPYNETSHIEYKRSSRSQITEFYDILKKEKINVTIRREFGSKVSAACGQLRSNSQED